MSNLHIPIATRIPPLRADLDYSTVPTIHQYGSSYIVLGGLHRPKKMRVDDSVGGIYHELFKGDDETRQDAVLGQVFGIANKILADDRQTKTRNLRFRTYVVIPLAHKSGILEFVAGQSIGDYLKPAHDRYRGEGDVSSSHFRAALVAVQEKKLGDPVKLRAVYEKYLPLFPPVMRHFFTEKHKDPMGWFAMRLNYSRSLAVTSMVGWVLGIGDRHLSNIMIDLKTGESIQIDFGVIFEAVSFFPALAGRADV
jgi:ataxia telangiectasia mutated family protein